MNKTNKCVHFLAFIFLLATAGCAQESGLVESWEVRHNERQPPQKVMDAIGVKPGMVIGEVGAGTGRYTVHLALRVGDAGKIYANDINKRSLDHLKQRCEKHGINNVEIVLGEVADPLFPENSLDVAFMINVYHHLDKPIELVRNIIPALKPGAVLAIVEATLGKPEASVGHATRKEEFIEQMEEAGYDVIRIETFLSRDNIYIMRPKDSDQ